MSELFFAGGFPWWAVAAVALGAAALLVYQFLGLRERLGSRRSGLLAVLRAAVYALLVFFLLSPGLVQKRVSKLKRPLAVVLDTSQSMAFPATFGNGAKPGKSRIDLVKEKLLEGKDSLMERLARDYDLRVYQLSTGLTPLAPSTLSQLSAAGQGTRLLEALREAGREEAGGGAILLFSDGIANGEEKMLDASSSLPLPVVAVGVGDSQGYTDLRVADLGAPEFAFRGRELKIDFTVQAYGLAGKTVPLYLNRGKNLISSRSINIDRDAFEQRITLSYTPKEIGAHSFAVSLPPQPGEVITQNNQKEFKVEVKRDKIRVLTLSGSPSWNYRFLRMALKQDPFIDLVSFVFLRTPTDVVDVPDSQLSLIPFPIDEIFLEELKNFDVLLLDDFSHRSYFNMLYLEKLRDFVRDGGGLAMFGGVRSFDSGGFADSPLREALPVELDGKGTYQIETRVRGTLTAVGRAHPVTRLVPDPQANEEAWKKMPPLTTFNQILRAKGETLLQADSGLPLLTVGRFGKGRTLALMSDDVWRWSFAAVGNGESPQHHLKLVRHAVRWLGQEPTFEQVRIESIAGARTPGGKSEINVRVMNDDFTPASHAAVRMKLAGPEGEETTLEAAQANEAGSYRADFVPVREGTYRVEAEAQLAGKVLGKDRRNFLVAFPYGEEEDGRPRPELLKQIAEKSHGEFIPIADLNPAALDRIAAKLERLAPSEVIERREIPLWSTLWTFALILALLSSEWWLRRKWGLI
ncbi:MAG: hypothetical protein A3F90_09205 [Deltaproteobacteria bacterium RIFCSPLOWO2_12_FULL_60_19]|nr:MAG: hypothetical protein A3F90_09205 [Deltaproteobacteria bacterium RIFCSPLOWO2_12_FULL_60_19]